MANDPGIEQAMAVTLELQELVRAGGLPLEGASAKLRERMNKFVAVAGDLYEFLSSTGRSIGAAAESSAARGLALQAVPRRRSSRLPSEVARDAAWTSPSRAQDRRRALAGSEGAVDPEADDMDGSPEQDTASPAEGCRNRCNCKKSHCLKLYCECFAAGGFCGTDCSCDGCANGPGHEELIEQSRAAILARSPTAFKPKVAVGGGVHKKGCRCRKSRCLKKYCECFQANVRCTSACRCEECANCDPTGRSGFPPGALPTLLPATATGLGGGVLVAMNAGINTHEVAPRSRASAHNASSGGLPTDLAQLQPRPAAAHNAASEQQRPASNDTGDAAGQPKLAAAAPMCAPGNAVLGSQQLLTSAGLVPVFVAHGPTGPVLVPAANVGMSVGSMLAPRGSGAGMGGGMMLMASSNGGVPMAFQGQGPREQWRLPGGPLDIMAHVNAAAARSYARSAAAAAAGSAGGAPDSAKVTAAESCANEYALPDPRDAPCGANPARAGRHALAATVAMAGQRSSAVVGSKAPARVVAQVGAPAAQYQQERNMADADEVQDDASSPAPAAVLKRATRLHAAPLSELPAVQPRRISSPAHAAVSERSSGGSHNSSGASGNSGGNRTLAPNAKRRVLGDEAGAAKRAKPTQASSWCVPKRPRSMRRAAAASISVGAPAAATSAPACVRGDGSGVRLPSSSQSLLAAVVQQQQLDGSMASRSSLGAGLTRTTSEELTSPLALRPREGKPARGARLARPSAGMLHAVTGMQKRGGIGSLAEKLPLARDIWQQQLAPRKEKGLAKEPRGCSGKENGRASSSRGQAYRAPLSAADCDDAERDVIAALCDLSNASVPLSAA